MNEKPKRQDVSLRLKNKKNIVERTVSCSFPMRLGLAFDDPSKCILNQEIEQWIMTTSKIIHRMSLIFNRFLLFCCSHNREMPLFQDSFFTNMALYGLKKTLKQSKNDYSLLQDYCDNEFHTENFPIIKRQRGDCQAIVIACLKYKVNFLNSLRVPFFERQKKYIIQWLLYNKVDYKKGDIYHIQSYMNGWKTTPNDLPLLITQFIKEERDHLGHQTIDQTWLDANNNSSLILHYYFHILQFYTEKECGKKFRLAPLCQIKRHFLTIDNTVLREILLNVRKKCKDKDLVFPNWISEKIDQKEMSLDVWKNVFNYEGLRRKRTFSHRIDTDGVKICFHFQMTKKTPSKTRTKNGFLSKQKERVIAIDPGRVNLITAYDEETNRYYKLTRKYYYRACGIKAFNKKCILTNLKCKGIYEAMSKTPTRSIKEQDWYNYQMLVTRHYNQLWEMNTTIEQSRGRFRVSRLKEKCLDRFLNQWNDPNRKTVLAYGGAVMNPTGKGELSVPVKYIYEKCKERYQTEIVDEKYTTMKHFRCKKQTADVFIESKKTRGLRWCPTCRELVSRDKNACQNISMIYKSEERPTYLCDTEKKSDLETKRLKKVNSHTATITKGS